MSEIITCIEQQAGHLATFGSGLLEYFVLRNGKAFTPIAPQHKQGRKKECFSNATHLVFENKDKGYRYCEGYALRREFGFLIHHAWVVDANDNAIDVTWDNPTECEVFGVPFTNETLIREMQKNGVYGLLDIGMLNVELMEEIDPSVVAFLNKQVEKRKELRRLMRQVEEDMDN